jgi:hypothetical protein
MIVLMAVWYGDGLCRREAHLFIMVNVVDGDHFTRQKLVCSVFEYCGGKVLHDGLGLHVQVPNYGIRIRSKWTLPQNSSMAPPSRRLLALISWSWKPVRWTFAILVDRRVSVTSRAFTAICLMPQ